MKVLGVEFQRTWHSLLDDRQRLKEVFTSDPERLSRFEGEARTLAALNHPNIGAIYGFEEADGLQFLILELVDGQRSNLARIVIPPRSTVQRQASRNRSG